ncbi:uncharacterized protein LOC108089423 [Drosophila ficusphila]|uniref:uncharacterized protein LOC108089423 n=1 Tax=Drosophila ficusphila TaxID=30025 RepID=UPI001C8A6F53|nr:uncharacterized protein LOC108089423 [Drosophila ficusphila]
MNTEMKRTTPGPGGPNAYRNFLACFKQENFWLQESDVDKLANIKWADFDRNQRQEFYANRYKVNMEAKLKMVTIEPFFGMGTGEPCQFINIDDIISPVNSCNPNSVETIQTTAEVHASEEPESPYISDSNLNKSRQSSVCAMENLNRKSTTRNSAEWEPISKPISELSHRNSAEWEPISKPISELSHKSISEVDQADHHGISKTVITEMSISTVTIRGEPFANFLQEFSVEKGTKPRENVKEASAKWDQMNATEKEAYTAENYVLKLCSQVRNFDQFFDPLVLNQENLSNEPMDLDELAPSDNSIKHTVKPKPRAKGKAKNTPAKKVRKLPKRTAKKVRGVQTPMNEPENHEAPEPMATPLRRAKYNSGYLNFLRELRRVNSGPVLSVEATNLWRKLPAGEKDMYKDLSKTVVQKKPARIITRKSSVQKPQTRRKPRAAKVQLVDAANLTDFEPVQQVQPTPLQSNIDVATSTDFMPVQQVQETQLEVYQGPNTNIPNGHSWQQLFSRAARKVKNIFY